MIIADLCPAQDQWLPQDQWPHKTANMTPPHVLVTDESEHQSMGWFKAKIKGIHGFFHE